MKIAFVGGFGHHYLRGALKDPSLNIQRPVAYVPTAPEDRDPAERLAEPAGELQVYANLEAVFEQYKPDVVNVGAIYSKNSDYIEAAIAHGIPVISDKPIATTWEKLKRLRRLCEEKSGIVLTEFDFRSRREFRAARNAVKQGLIGDPVLVTGQKSYRFGTRPKWYADRETYGGTIPWVASHAIDAVRFVTGKEIAAVTGRQGNLSRPDFGTMEDHTTTLMELDNGGSAIVHADFLRPAAALTHGDDRIRVAGTKGVLEVRAGRCVLITETRPDEDITESVEVKPIAIELLEAIQGRHPDLYSTAESFKSAELLLHARDSADQQKWIAVSS